MKSISLEDQLKRNEKEIESLNNTDKATAHQFVCQHMYKNIEIYSRNRKNSENFLKNKLIEFDINYSYDGKVETLTIQVDKNVFASGVFNCYLASPNNSLIHYEILNVLLKNDKKILKALKNYLSKLAWVNSDLPLV